MALSETANRWLIWSAAVAAIIALRVGCVLYERSRPFSPKRVAQRPIEKDYLVTLPKSYVNDFTSAQKLEGQTLWVKAGYLAEYFPYVGPKRTAGSLVKQTFAPLEKIQVQKVVERPLPSRSTDKEVLLLFQKEGQDFATVAGYFDSTEDQYRFQVDDLLYLKNPHQIYAHWSEETWQKIQNHQLEKEMSFAQVALSIGSGSLVTTEAGSTQLY